MELQRGNRTLQEIAKTMINKTNVAQHFQAEAMNTACYIQNRISIRTIMEKTPYKLWNKKNLTFISFCCICFMLNIKDNLNKFDYKAQKCIMLGYSERTKGYNS